MVIGLEPWCVKLLMEFCFAHIVIGLEQATLAADQAGLELLGEVLPQSGLWHMRQPRRCKRSADQVQTNDSNLHQD